MEVAGPLGTPLGLAQRKRASPRGEAGTSGFLSVSDSDRRVPAELGTFWCIFLLCFTPFIFLKCSRDHSKSGVLAETASGRVGNKTASILQRTGSCRSALVFLDRGSNTIFSFQAPLFPYSS